MKVENLWLNYRISAAFLAPGEQGHFHIIRAAATWARMLSGTNVLNPVTRDTAVSSMRVSHLRSYPNMEGEISKLAVSSNVACVTEAGASVLKFL